MTRANVLEADFGHNFRNAIGSEDQQLTDDLILNEIASLIESKPLTIIQIMGMFGQKFIGSTTGDLVKAVTQMLQTSPKFRVALSILIALNNGIVTLGDVQAAGLGDMSAFATTKYHNDGGAGGAMGGSGAMGGGDWISSLIGAVGGITSSSLQLAAAKQNKKSTEIAAQSGLEQAKINAEAMGNSSQEATKQELLKTLGIKIASGSNTSLPGWVWAAIVLLIGGIIGFIFLRSNRGGNTMPAITPAPVTPVVSSTHTANPNMPSHATGGQVVATPPVTPPATTV